MPYENYIYIHIWLTAPITDLQGNTIWHKITIRNIMMKPIKFYSM